MGTLSIADDKFNFDGLEFVAQKVYVPYYYSQPRIDIHLRGNKLAVTAGGTLENNTYTWQNVDTKKSMVIKGGFYVCARCQWSLYHKRKQCHCHQPYFVQQYDCL